MPQRDCYRLGPTVIPPSAAWSHLEYKREGKRSGRIPAAGVSCADSDGTLPMDLADIDPRSSWKRANANPGNSPLAARLGGALGNWPGLPPPGASFPTSA